MEANQIQSPPPVGNDDQLAIIFGPSTRLAQALLATPGLSSTNLLLVARTQQESQALAARYPASQIVLRSDLPQSLPPANQLTVYCCAAGPIHQGTVDLAEATADLSAIQTTITHYSQASLHFVLVSSVLALVYSSSRATYSGWKVFLEGTIAQLINGLPSASMSVVYPGRLIEIKSLTKPLSLCYTRYQRLAAYLIALARRRQPTRTIIGKDARLWLGVRRAGALVSGFVGR